jgi:hypothetical protein
MAKGSVESRIPEGDLTAIVLGSEIFHAECLIAKFVGLCPHCDRAFPKGALTQHQKACR